MARNSETSYIIIIIERSAVCMVHQLKLNSFTLQQLKEGQISQKLAITHWILYS